MCCQFTGLVTIVHLSLSGFLVSSIRVKPHSFLHLLHQTLNYPRMDLPHFDMPLKPAKGLK